MTRSVCSGNYGEWGEVVSLLARARLAWVAGVLLLNPWLGEPTAQAQAEAVLTGTVVDASTHRPVADVVVTATSQNLAGRQVAVTDETGLFRIPQLPPGSYALRFEKGGYSPFSRSNIDVRLGTTLRFNAELLPNALGAEELVVVGKAPIVDVGSTSVGSSVGPELINNLALVRPSARGAAARSFEALAELAPGAIADAYGISLNGATSPENGLYVDGLAVGNPALGINGTPLSVQFIQELNVMTSGFMPEFGRSTSGIISAVTKSGSNDFHGALFGTFTPGALQGSPTRVKRAGTAITTDQRLWNLGDFGFELGGPVLRDKLWFYVGMAPNLTRVQLERQLNRIQLNETGIPERDENGFVRTTPIPGTQSFYFADQRGLQYIGKLTWLIGNGHRLSLSVHGTPTTSGGHGTFGFDPSTGAVETANNSGVSGIAGTYESLAHVRRSDSLNVAIKLTSSSTDKHALLDVTAGWHSQRLSSLPVDGSQLGAATGLAGIPQFWMRRTGTSAVPRYYSLNDFETLPDPTVCEPKGAMNAKVCPVDNYFLGGPGALAVQELDRFQVDAVGTWIVTAWGHHVAKAGLDFDLGRNHEQRAYSGGVLYRESVLGNYFQDYRQYGYLARPDNPIFLTSVDIAGSSYSFGGFIQDSWSILDAVSLNGGLRYDRQALYGNDGLLALALPDQLSPRVGVVYDITQEGRSRLFANYARFYQSGLLAILSEQFSGASQLQAYRNRAPGSTAPGCDPTTQAAPYIECRDPANLRSLSQQQGLTYPEDPEQHYLPRLGVKSPVDSTLRPQSADELQIGGEFQVFNQVRAGIVYTRRSMNEVVEDMSRTQGTSFFIGNPGLGIASDFPRAERTYDAVTLSLARAFSDHWLAQTSYTLSYLRGNYSGLFRPETNRIGPNFTADFDVPSLTINRTGPLPMDHTHAIKAQVAREFSVIAAASVVVGFSYQGLSGGPLNVLAADPNPNYDRSSAFVLPRGSGGRLPWVHSVDGHLGVDFHLSKGSVATLSVDVFNLFNFQAAINADQDYTYDAVSVTQDAKKEVLSTLVNTAGQPVNLNPNYGNPTAYQPPRSVRFGAKVAF